MSALPHSSRLWFDARPVEMRSNGSAPTKEVYACPVNHQIYEAKTEQEAADLVAELNASALKVLGS